MMRKILINIWISNKMNKNSNNKIIKCINNRKTNKNSLQNRQSIPKRNQKIKIAINS